MTMLKTNAAMKILLENAKTFAERNKIHALMESEMHAVNNAMVTNLYKSAIEKSHIDFEDIPQSRGDVTKYAGYKSMLQTISLLQEIAAKNNTRIGELDIVETALSNIVAYRDLFEKGFAFQKEFVILQYNTLVYACVEALSTIISSYVDFIKRPDRVEFTIIRDKTRGGNLCIVNLEKFNLSVKQGDFSRVLNSVINTGKEGFVGVNTVMIPAIVVGSVLALVPLIRELIFLFHYSRMRLSDYLEQQATLLEINRQSIEASNMPAKKKNEVLKKQAEYIEKLRHMSNKIKVDRVTSETKATGEMSKQNKAWTIDTVKTQAASMDQGGFQLL